MDEHPIGVTILTILLVILGIYVMMMGFLGMSGSLISLIFPLADTNLNFLLNIANLVLGVFILGMALSLFQLQRWAWAATLVVLVILAIRDILFIFYGGGVTPVLSLILAVILIIYLAVPSVRKNFAETPRK